jgi:GH24 family phage-related lysozyme (muramidase)
VTLKIIYMPQDFQTRVKAVQSRLGVAADGDFGKISAIAFEQMAGLAADPAADKQTHIKAIQRFLGTSVDGSFGPATLTRVEAFLDTRVPKIPSGGTMMVSRKGMELLISFEVSSKQAYNKSYKNPIWPGGASGVTIGIGYDLGHNSKATIAADWGNKIPAADLALLQSVSGLTGAPAKNALAPVRSVVISYEAALEVFYQRTLSVYARQTKKAYPGVEKLPPDAQAALLSLVYNRGAALEGTNRGEMKNIVALVAAGDLAGIAKQIRNMKRIWAGKGLPGLIDRREREAVLTEQASFNILPEDIIVV